MRQAFALPSKWAFFGRPAALLLAIVLSLSFAAEAVAAKYAAIVVDANTGKVLHSSSADSRRYPASLTKMMTLYLTFEALQRGKIKTTSQVRFSQHAASQPPTKLGVKAGGSISVETAIYALITRSANDASSALAELLGGSEADFAKMMTAKARSLGMKSTVFRNPHGLPNTGQFTTARDMATLGIALREHFPQYYDYFSTRSFKYGKQRIANHNRLLGRIEGVDGIKTGYTRASGFNLVSSVVDGNRKIVAVVLGGESGRSRDNRMAELIKTYLPKASGRGGGGDLIAKTDPKTLKDMAVAMLPKSDAPTPDERPDAFDVSEGDANDVADAIEEYKIASAGVAIEAPAAERFGGDVPTPKLLARQERVEAIEQAYADPAPRPKVAVDPISTASTRGGSGWSIQVASSPSESEARKALESIAQKAGAAVASASAYTVTFEKDGTLYYRARFGGFETKTAAWSACGALKKKKIACYATQ
ncbi:D-alanyl-D-alanine carboxypeptidase [Arvimicrobium flavum]|uniref:D-alanyl-D-alanine carboxypeptidase n=1 Tax=Arvimicrobium flavum TaxID=3393320 RepID=UPI00237A3CBA|nr:D-alanyl-D-alanine carboxypeptidase [Mesorhizobium shangrilense]